MTKKKTTDKHGFPVELGLHLKALHGKEPRSIVTFSPSDIPHYLECPICGGFNIEKTLVCEEGEGTIGATILQRTLSDDLYFEYGAIRGLVIAPKHWQLVIECDDCAAVVSHTVEIG